MRTSRGWFLVILLLAPVASAQDRALPEGCRAEGERYLCEWVVDPAEAPDRRIHRFDLPVFARTEANLTVAANGRHAGWYVDILDRDADRTLARIHEVGEHERDVSSTTYPALLLADPAHAHELKFNVEVVEREKLSPDVPEAAWPGSPVTFRLVYVAVPLPEGEPAPPTDAGRENPHLLDPERDAPRPDLDVVAAWLADPRVGDGTFDVHVALADLAAHSNPEDDEGPQEVVFYRMLFDVGGVRHMVEWTWPVGLEDEWLCELRIVRGSGQYSPRSAVPACVFDVEGSLLTASLLESAVGRPAPDLDFTGMHARAETQLPLGMNVADVVLSGGNGTRVDDEVAGQRMPFRLATHAPAEDGGELAVTTAGARVAAWLGAGALAVAGVALLVTLPLVAALRRRRMLEDAVLDESSRELARRSRELYRASLERLLDDRLSLSSASKQELSRLRARLGLTDEDHAELERDVVQRLTAAPGAARHEPLAVGTPILGRYRVEALLGEGGGGRTYRCEDTLLGRVVAIKQIDTFGDAAAHRAALREARALASVRHPRVVTLLDVHELDGQALLVMEYAEGGSLAAALRARGALPPAEAASVLRDVLDGLQALHDAGLLHRDVKPSNVLLDRDGRAMLTDLGLARSSAHVTMSGLRRAGTPLYMAPEQVLELDLDARTDVYGAAGLLYELLAGEPCVRAAMREGVLVEEAIVSEPPPLPLAGAPAWANRLLEAGLAKEPARRPASAAEMRRLVPAA